MKRPPRREPQDKPKQAYVLKLPPYDVDPSVETSQNANALHRKPIDESTNTVTDPLTTPTVVHAEVNRAIEPTLGTNLDNPIIAILEKEIDLVAQEVGFSAHQVQIVEASSEGEGVLTTANVEIMPKILVEVQIEVGQFCSPKLEKPLVQEDLLKAKGKQIVDCVAQEVGFPKQPLVECDAELDVELIEQHQNEKATTLADTPVQESVKNNSENPSASVTNEASKDIIPEIAPCRLS